MGHEKQYCKLQVMAKKLEVIIKQENAYMLNESKDSEVIYSIHVPYKIHSYFSEAWNSS